MALFDGLLELIAPTRCAGCDLPGQVLCAGCRSLAVRYLPSQSCPRCGAPFGAMLCTECHARVFAFEAALAVGELGAPLARAVVLYKDGGERRLAAVLGELVGCAVEGAWGAWPDCVSFIPATRKARSRRGFDHAEEIAIHVAKILGVPARPLLAREAAEDQRRLSREQRALNAGRGFSAVGKPPDRVLLVDDVFTTGATLDAAAGALLDAGAASVRVAVVARAW